MTDITQQPFFIRMKEELDQLRDRKTKLASFLETESFDQQPHDIRSAMTAQLGAMEAYDFALTSRIIMISSSAH